jgi:hypothetical protein
MGNFCANERTLDDPNHEDNQVAPEVKKEDGGLQHLSAGHKKEPVSSLPGPEKATKEETEAFFAGPAAYFGIPADSGIFSAIKNSEWFKLPVGDASIEYFKAQLVNPAGRPYKYFGQMKNDSKHGNGQVYFTDGKGELVVCNFTADNADGEGVVYFEDGGFFKGTLAGHEMRQGTLTLPTKDTYKGSFIGNKFSGHGHLALFDGRSYEGEFRDGSKEGKGTYKWANGDSYVGDWLNGKQHGQGVLTRGGQRIEGSFYEGKKIKST